MNWEKLSMSQRSELISIYLKNGITSLDEMKKHYNSFAGGGFTSPDHDPNNPYHYHVNGQKVVVTPEDWEKYKNDPTFREIRAAVEAEQAAHPVPEYDEVENPAWRKAYQNLVNGVNLKGRDNVSQPLPQDYTRDTKGVVMDASGNYYIPKEQASNVPYFINQERGMFGNIVPVRYEQQQMPDRTIRQLRQPLPVDRVMNIGEERKKAIIKYINDNSKKVQMYRRPWFKADSDPVIWVYGKKEALSSPSYADGRGDAFGWHGFEIYDNDSDDAEQYSANNLITEEEFKQAVNLIPGWGNFVNVGNPNLWVDKKIIRKPSQQEVENNAVISINSFAGGGELDTPLERFFGIATPEVTDNTVYQPTYGTMLPEVKVTTERPSWQRSLTDYDLARLRSGQINSETAKSIAQYRDTGTSGYMKDVNKLSWIPNGTMALAGGLSGALVNPYLMTALGLASGIQNIEDKNYGEAALDFGLSMTGPVLKGVNTYVQGVKPRLAEVLLSAGDALMNKPIETSKRLVKNRKALSYIFNPWEKPSTAYELGPYFNYSGTEALSEPMVNKKTGEILILDGNSSRYPGDVLDLFLGKNLDRAQFPLTKKIPKGITNYTQSRYGINNPRVYDLGIVDNEANAVQTESMGIYKNGRPVLDPGHHKTYGKNDIGTLHYDIWKYNPDDFEKRWIKSDWPKWKRIAAKKAAAFIDEQGEPIAHIWTQPYGTGLVNDSPTLSSPLLKDLGITDMDLQHILKSPPPIIQLANGGKIFIKPENRGKFTALKERTGHSASWFKENGTPAQKKMAIFELNSKKWRK